MKQVVKTNKLQIENYNKDSFLITTKHARMTVSKDHFEEYLIRGMTDNLKDLLGLNK